jgi:hypothetical protein
MIASFLLEVVETLIPGEEGVGALRGLAALARQLRPPDPPDRQGIEALIGLAKCGRAEAALGFSRCLEAAKQSTLCFPNLGEPLEQLDFTGHRWVAGHREEAYSDWLAWIVSDLTALDILQIFGVTDADMIAACENVDAAYVSREVLVEHGHEGRTGRLDLDIDFDGKARLVVELKIVDAEHADTAKHAGYCRSILTPAAIPCQCVLVARNPGEEDYQGFRARRWTDVCIELRIMAAELIKEGYLLSAAMTLSFVAAVEQNLLGFHIAGEQPESLRGLRSVATAEHLMRFVTRMKENNS